MTDRINPWSDFWIKDAKTLYYAVKFPTQCQFPEPEAACISIWSQREAYC